MAGQQGSGLSRRRILGFGTAVAGGLIAPTVLAGCGDNGSGSTGGQGSKGSGGNASLTFWDTNAGPDRTPEWKHLISDFEKSDKSVKVQYVGIPESQYLQKMQTAIAGGQVPDVANVGAGSISPFIAQDGLLPLDDYFDKWDQKSDFADKVIASVRSVSSDKKLYAIPFTANVNVLFYRKDLIKQAGLPDPGSSWDNFYKIAKALTKPSQGMYGFGLRGGSGSVTTIESWLYAATGIATYFDGEHCTLADPAMVPAFQKWIDMYGKVTSKSDLNNEYRAMVAEFDGKHAAMIFHNLGSYPDHVKALGAENVGVTVLPPAPNGKKTLEGLAYTVYVIMKGSKEQDAAWKLIESLSSPESQSWYNQQIGQLPADIKGAQASWVAKSPAAQAANKALADKNSVIVNPPLYLPAYATTQAEMEPSMQKVLIGQLSAKDFLSQWATKMDTAYAQYKKSH